MKRIMIIPAAGTGSRLGSDLPKALASLGGRPMIDQIFDLYSSYVELFVVVVNPSAIDVMDAHFKTLPHRIEISIQAEPTGMLDAIMAASEKVSEVLNKDDDRVWITWCDQAAIEPQTVLNLAERSNHGFDLVLPTVFRSLPYIHFERNQNGKIVRVRQRREGDEMPKRGEGDVGLFSLSRRAYVDLLPLYAQLSNIGKSTGERNFLPFVAWLNDRGTIDTFQAVSEIEALGINTPEDLAIIAAHFDEHRKTFGCNSGL